MELGHVHEAGPAWFLSVEPCLTALSSQQCLDSASSHHPSRHALVTCCAHLLQLFSLSRTIAPTHLPTAGHAKHDRVDARQ